MPNSNFAKLFSGFAIIVAFVGAIVGFFLFGRYQRFYRHLDELRAAGQPVVLSDFSYKVTDSDNDALTYLNRIFKDDSVFEFKKKLLEGTSETAYDDPVTEQIIARYELLVKEFPDLFPNLEAAATAPDISVEFLGDSLFLETFWLRDTGSALYWKARVLNATGKPDQSIQSSLHLINLSAHYDKQPTIMTHMVANACRTLAASAIHEVLTTNEVTAKTRQQINIALENADSPEPYINAVLSERAYGFEGVVELGFWSAVFYGNKFSEDMKTVLVRAEMPLSVQFPEEDPVGPLEFPPFNADYNHVSPFNNIRNSTGSKRSMLRALRVINALQASPDLFAAGEISQDDLVSIGVPKEMTLDLFTDRPMTIKRVADQWLVYSWGPDQTDNGGDLSGGKDVGLGPNLRPPQ